MRPSILITFLFLALKFSAQKYNFVNWSVEDGLVQSQASIICQDKFRQLWIGTEGGMSCFDGKKFRSYTVQDGLPANHVASLLSDRDSLLWIGTRNGLVSFDGKKFRKHQLDTTAPDHVRSALQLNDTTLYFVSNFMLYEVVNGNTSRVIISGDSSEKVSAMCVTPGGAVLACVYGKGVFTGQGRQWSRADNGDETQQYKVIFRCFISSAGDTLLSYNNGLFVLRNKNIVLFTLNGRQPDVRLALCMEEDAKKQLWIGTDRGVCKVENGSFVYYHGQSGFTDNTVNHIFRDAENNLWFATNADGIYKFRENTFTYYDKSSGLENPIVMGITQTADSLIYIAGYGGGLYYTNASQGLKKAPGAEKLNETKINCLYADPDNTIWIGTLNQGIFSYTKERGLRRLKSEKNRYGPAGATVFHTDEQGRLLIGGSQGLFVLSKDGFVHLVEMPGLLVSAIKKFDSGHSIIGTSGGLFLLDSNLEVKPFHETELGHSSVMCLAKNGSDLWIGTSDKGIYYLNLLTSEVRNYSTIHGLPSNFIYSIDAAEKKRLWAGTGFGISKLDLDQNSHIRSIKNYGRSDGLLGMECNHNSLLRAADSSLWFGTTRGLFRFDPQAGTSETTQPLVLLRSVKLFSSEISDSSLFREEGHWFDVPKGLELSSGQNHLSFELGALYFTNPDDILYRYKLEGIDKGHTTTSNPLIMYPSLPPGKYVLKVKGLTKSGIESVNEVSYAFTINKAFYQTGWFRFMVIVLLVGAGALIAYTITRARHRRRQKEKELHEKIREEEFSKLRQRTAEDFHDEMGNSLTRISVLTDVLRKKLNGSEKEVTHLVQQIRDNTTALYNGSRDIIWSLNSKNDDLYEIAEHISDIGREVFQDTAVEFRFSHNIPPQSDLKLKLDYSRNLTMIFKEAYSNILKHAGAARVEVEMDLGNEGALRISIHDNGHGFSAGETKKGNGLNNMRNRVGRMQGRFNVSSTNEQGTTITILFDDIFVNAHG